MTKERLEAYRSMTDEIEELQARLDHLKDDEDLTVADTVLDYRSGQGIPKHIVGINEKRYWRRRQQYSDRIKALQKECEQVEEWIERIEDSMTRRIFRMAYIDGMTYTDIGKIIHMDRSGIGKRIGSFVKKTSDF